ncbi:MAG: beta-lactamase family protein [Deltaproteobacteria bacterium]|nr:beta-lactamase family protein [Deltaproteobacteria bacterium]
MPRPRYLQRLRHSRIDVPDDLSTVTRVAEEDDPSAGGMTQRDIDAIWTAAERLFRRGLHPTVQLCLRRNGRVVLNRSIGYSHGGSPDMTAASPRTVATPETPICIFSASKAITAMVVHLLDEDGVLHVDDRVADYIPEFGQHGKDWITLRHVLTHRAGIPTTGGRGDLELLTDWDAIVQLLCEAEPVSRPGHRLSYHALTGGWVLGEVVRRVTGKDLRQVLRERILEPLGIARLNYGVPAADVPLVAENSFTGVPVFPPFSGIAQFVLGMSFEEAALLSNEPQFLTSIVPSGNIVGTAEEMGRFLQMLLDEGMWEGERVFEARTVRRATQQTSFRELDLSLLLPLRYGLGFMLGGKFVSPFGPNTQAAFGHLGLMNIHCWADRWRQTSVSLLTTGKPLVADHIPALYMLLKTITDRTPRV